MHQYFLLHEQSLIRLADRERVAVEKAPGDGRSSPAALARAAASVAAAEPPADGGVILLLPPQYFIVTRHQLPPMPAEELAQALLLQQRQLLPGIESELLVAADGGDLALWIRAETAEAMFEAFAEQGLMLAGLAPRVCVHNRPPNRELNLLDRDESTITHISFDQQGLLRRWRQVSCEDLADQVMRREWEEYLTAAAAEGGEPTTIETGEEWQRESVLPAALPALCLMPPTARRDLTRRKRRRLQIKVGLLIGGGLLLLLLPLLGLKLANSYLDNRVSKWQERGRGVLTLQAEVAAFEEGWAVLHDFPALDLATLLAKLEETIPPDSWLTSLNVADGVVEIEGVSGNGAKLLEALSAQPDFLDLSLSKALRAGTTPGQGDQFGIRFRLKNLEVDGYLRQHFPVPGR